MGRPPILSDDARDLAEAIDGICHDCHFEGEDRVDHVLFGQLMADHLSQMPMERLGPALVEAGNMLIRRQFNEEKTADATAFFEGILDFYLNNPKKYGELPVSAKERAAFYKVMGGLTVLPIIPLMVHVKDIVQAKYENGQQGPEGEAYARRLRRLVTDFENDGGNIDMAFLTDRK